MELPQRLSKAIKSRRVVPFVGSGLSRQIDGTKFPSWSDLIAELLTNASNRGYIKDEQAVDVSALIDSKQLAFAAELIRKNTPRDEFMYFLESRFSFDTSAYALEEHLRLLRLEPNLIMTTNYDRLLEDAYARLKRRAPVVGDFRDSVRIHNRLQRTKTIINPIIFKIHGDIEDIDSMIICENDFKRIEYQEPTFNSILSNIFLNNVLLFIGYGMRDPEIIRHLEANNSLLRKSAQPHYALVPRRFSNRTEMAMWRDLYNVETIVYDAHLPQSNLLEILTEFERQL
jgi:hypothetical protein